MQPGYCGYYKTECITIQFIMLLNKPNIFWWFLLPIRTWQRTTVWTTDDFLVESLLQKKNRDIFILMIPSSKFSQIDDDIFSSKKGDKFHLKFFPSDSSISHPSLKSAWLQLCEPRKTLWWVVVVGVSRIIHEHETISIWLKWIALG